ncbi:hypothetical protein ACIGB8_01165 [Promicromonospora sukumoe]|uniref:hypothetical protein n=1 Tax=Promicromonospora sukumoe TaxID=88382 RepID=UPI0037C800E2
MTDRFPHALTGTRAGEWAVRVDPAEVFEFMGVFLSRFALLAVALTIAWGLFSFSLSSNVRVLRLATRHSPRTVVRNLRRTYSVHSRRPRAALADDVVDVTLVVALACAAAFVSVGAVLGNDNRSVALLLLAVYLAHVLGPTGLVRAYGWLYGRKSRIGFLPPPIPRTVGWTIPSKRREAAVNLYRLRLHHQLMLAALGGAFLMYLGEASEDPRLAEAVGLGASLLLAFACLQLNAVLIRRLAGRFHVLGLIAVVLKPRRTGTRGPELTVEQSRSQIVAIALATERYAHHLFHKQNRHPNAHLLSLEVALLRAYLDTFDSLTLEHPANITRSLRHISAVLIGARREFLQATQNQLVHLTDDITPAPARRAWTARLSDAVDLTDRTSKVVGLLISLGALFFLLWASEASVQDLASWLPWG